jgi:hypothetical protein
VRKSKSVSRWWISRNLHHYQSSTVSPAGVLGVELGGSNLIIEKRVFHAYPLQQDCAAPQGPSVHEHNVMEDIRKRRLEELCYHHILRRFHCSASGWKMAILCAFQVARDTGWRSSAVAENPLFKYLARATTQFV